MIPLIFDIQKFSTHDGEGVRTVIFFKGCNLNCFWCHNPESIRFNKELSINKNACKFCGRCYEICKENVHIIDENKHSLNIKNCKSCFKCVNVCEFNALEILGYERSIDQIVLEILKDKIFFDLSNGGVTLSGGEALMHFSFVKDLLIELKKHNIHVIIETNGTLNWSIYEQILPYVDKFYIDLKDTNKDNLFKNTKANLDNILSNLEKLSLLSKPFVLVCLIINTINNNKEHYDKVIQLYQSYKSVSAIKLLFYHDYGNAKLTKLGYEYIDGSNFLIKALEREEIKQYFIKNNINLIDF